MHCMDIPAVSILSGYQHNSFPASLALFVHGYKCGQAAPGQCTSAGTAQEETKTPSPCLAA